MNCTAVCLRLIRLLQRRNSANLITDHLVGTHMAAGSRKSHARSTIKIIAPVLPGLCRRAVVLRSAQCGSRPESPKRKGWGGCCVGPIPLLSLLVVRGGSLEVRSAENYTTHRVRPDRCWCTHGKEKQKEGAEEGPEA